MSYYVQCCCQGLEAQGQGLKAQGQGLEAQGLTYIHLSFCGSHKLDNDLRLKDKDLWSKDKDLQIGP